MNHSKREDEWGSKKQDKPKKRTLNDKRPHQGFQNDPFEQPTSRRQRHG